MSIVSLDEVQVMFNDYLLPQNIRLVAFNDQGPLFDTPYATRIPLSELSDGYRTLLVLTLDLLHCLFDECWFNHQTELWTTADNDLPHTDVLRHMSGIVLIDELDAHLHPSLQREIALKLRNFFPNLQFIIATHSPFIAQAADDAGLYVLQQEGNAVRAVHDATSVRGWRVDQILTSHLFGLDSTRSPEIADLLKEYENCLPNVSRTH